MIIVTGGAGFIGSALIWKLNQKGHHDILVVDHMGHGTKWKNLAKRRISQIIHKDEFFEWLAQKGRGAEIEGIFHMGACSSTTETDVDYLIKNNVQYSMKIFEYCTRAKVPLIYASSAATYGSGENGYNDDPKLLSKLRPINPYGYSKSLFDEWVMAQKPRPPFWAGLKFFNVYGPQEYHKGSQASVVLHAYPQVRDQRCLKLFKSYRDDIEHGDQARDFVYVKDVVDVMYHLYRVNRVAVSGIYNIGTGKARTFSDLGRAVFRALNLRKERFEWVEMPEQLRSQYQYFTEASLDLLRQKTGYKARFTSLEEGVLDYVKGYLHTDDPFL
jgi:ADP-L-glycero-D-manno-heptose 6-epimerase